LGQVRPSGRLTTKVLCVVRAALARRSLSAAHRANGIRRTSKLERGLSDLSVSCDMCGPAPLVTRADIGDIVRGLKTCAIDCRP
jgi:hypothetical protein